MNKQKYRRQWRKQQKAYERYAYRVFKKVFREWGKSIPFEDMSPYNYSAILVTSIDTLTMGEAYTDVWQRVGVLHGKRVQKTIDKETKNATVETFMEAINEYLRQHRLVNVESIKQTYIEDIIKILTKELEGELTMPEVVNRITRLVNSNRFYKWQAMRIARTESTAAANYAATVAGGSSVYLMEKVWISVQDSRTRRTPPDKFDHYHMNEVTTGQDEAFNVEGEPMLFPGDKENGTAGNIINCYLPGNFIESNIIEGQRSFYTGKAVEIITRRGESITVTPNHGILTKQGFVRANDIRIGDNLICNKVIANPVFRLINNYIKKKLFTVENVFSSLNKLWFSKKFMVTALDFDKDGKSMNGYIDIVYPKIKLRNSFVTKFINTIGNFNLKATNFKGVFISGFSPFYLFGSRNNTSSSRLVSFLNLSFPLCFRHVSPLNRLTFGLASKMNTKRFNVSSDNSAREANFLRELIDTDSRIISFDDVVDVRYFNFSGHVYDFSSVNGVNIVNNIYTSNCRCAVAYQAVRDEDGGLIRRDDAPPL